jgi:hypothetical protein
MWNGDDFHQPTSESGEEALQPSRRGSDNQMQHETDISNDDDNDNDSYHHTIPHISHRQQGHTKSGTYGLQKHLHVRQQQQPQEQPQHPHLYGNVASGIPANSATFVDLDLQSQRKRSLDLVLNASEMNYLANLCSSDTEGRDYNEAIAAFAAGQQIPNDLHVHVKSDRLSGGSTIPEETLDQLRSKFPQTFQAAAQANQEQLPSNYWELFEPLQYTPPSRQNSDQSPTNPDVATAEAIVASIECAMSEEVEQPIPIQQHATSFDIDVSRQELNLRRSMGPSQGSDNLIREFDRAQGLRFCHSKTTLATSRSRNKLINAMFGDEKKKKRDKKKGGTRKNTKKNEQSAVTTSSIRSAKPSAQAERSSLPSQLQRKGVTATTA